MKDSILSESIINEQRNALLKTYEGPDKVISIEDKLKELEEENKDRPHFGVKTNLPSLDYCLDGFRLGQLVVMSGPPKHGKTQMGLTFTKHFVEQGQRVLWFEFEYEEEEFLKDKMPQDIFGKIKVFTSRQIPRKGTLDWIEKRIIESNLKYGTQLVFIDNSDFLKDPESFDPKVSINHADYVERIFVGLKNIARTHRIIIFIFHHIRKSNWHSNKLPTSEELKDSGAPARLCDFVIMQIRMSKKDNWGNTVYDGNKGLIGVIETRRGKVRVAEIQLDEELRIFKELQEYSEADSIPTDYSNFV